MRKIIILLAFAIVAALSSCTTYYVASSTEPISLYNEVGAESPSYSVPAGSILLLKGSPKNGMQKVRYHDDQSWYWVSYSNLKLVPGFNPKKYSANYPAYESGSPVPSEGGYNATIQTGPRGGKYYINKNGKKTYVKRSTPSGSTKRVGGKGSRGGRRH